jgi:hypothetical protein
MMRKVHQKLVGKKTGIHRQVKMILTATRGVRMEALQAAEMNHPLIKNQDKEFSAQAQYHRSEQLQILNLIQNQRLAQIRTKIVRRNLDLTKQTLRIRKVIIAAAQTLSLKLKMRMKMRTMKKARMKKAEVMTNKLYKLFYRQEVRSLHIQKWKIFQRSILRKKC